MKHILYLLVLSVLATAVVSCESEDPSSSNNTTKDSITKELEVTPSKTSLGIYESFTIKARMTNTPLSDIKLHFDYGDGVKTTGYIQAGTVNYHSYDKVGTYTLTVKAIDVYTEDTVATKTLQMVVSDVIPLVAFDRDLIDTTVQILDYSVQFESVFFEFTTNAPMSKVYCRFGDGSTHIDSTSPGNSISHRYQSPGTYNVIVDVYNDKGNYWASDTMTCIIRLKEPTLAILTSSYNVSVALAVDSTSSLYPAMKSYGHFDVGIGKVNDATPDLTWSGNTLNARFVNGTQQDYHCTGTISSDLKKLETMTVSIHDSANVERIDKYGYTLSNIEFYGMNNEVVIYRAAYKPLSSFVNNEFIQADNLSYLRHVGSISDMLEFCTRSGTPLPYAYVVFTRK